ncbi:hypothetical protein KZZ52_39680 [Dactylosporangium sp. AC04546]|uniref:hypothetical protein n=1 Tax=Dactylosporangium sp. AC04546 TaxID=2862460 RepID=UPI001EDD0049|nr:hypothetical protein [Dactylosporangium sp. AC04546]WVK80070.1 hypothetical protein KZZ52_39680 [Dactylosporangium sp. AC04546]
MTTDDRPLRLRPAVPGADGQPDLPEPAPADPVRVRALAAEIGQPGVPVSLREARDLPAAGAGTGHWQRHADRLGAAVERCRAAVDGVPPGAVRDELARLLHIVGLRAGRYVRIAAVGQAVAPDDDTTLADGTRPGERPELAGAAAEIDERLVAAVAHLAAVARAVEEIALATSGGRDAAGLPERLAALFATLPEA